MSVRVLSGRVLAVALLAASGVLGLTACGGGGGDGGGGPGGGGSGGGAAGAPPLPAVNYSGRTALATVNEQDAYLLADALDSAVVLTIDLGEIADPFILELGTTGSFNETLESPEGGSVRRRGARTAEATGWVELSYSGWREDGTVTDGRLVIEALTPPQTAQTLRARVSLHDLRIRDGDTVDRTFTGTLTREVTGLRGTFGEDRSVYTGRFLQRDNLAGQTRLIGPITLNDRPFFASAPSEPAREVRISGEVSLSDLGRLQIPDSGPMGYVRQGGFGVDWKFRGSLTGTGAASAALRLTGLSVDWGVLELDAIHDLALEDLTGNGVADLLISGRFGGSDTAVLRLYPGVSQGRFAPPIDTVVDDTGWLAVADLRGNGTPQVLLRSRAGVSILRVDAGGGLTALEFLPRSTDCEALEETGPPRQGLGLFIGEVHVADVDGDGRLDIVHYYRCVDGYIEVFRQTPDGGWSAPVASTIWPDAGWPGPLALAELDGNGRTEIAFAAQTLEFPFLDVFLGRAREDGGFDFELMNAGASAPPLFVDLDGDGRVDLLLSDESRLLIRHGLGDGSFAAPVTVSALTDLPIQRIFTLSLSDGELPTIMVAGQGRFELVEQRAPRLYEAAGLTVPTYNIATPHTMRIVATDLTGDGRNDLLIAGRQWAGMTVQRPLPPLEGMGVSGSLEPRTSAARAAGEEVRPGRGGPRRLHSP